MQRTCRLCPWEGQSFQHPARPCARSPEACPGTDARVHARWAHTAPQKQPCHTCSVLQLFLGAGSGRDEGLSMLNTPTTSGDNGTPQAAAPVSVRVGIPRERLTSFLTASSLPRLPSSSRNAGLLPLP